MLEIEKWISADEADWLRIRNIQEVKHFSTRRNRFNSAPPHPPQDSKNAVVYIGLGHVFEKLQTTCPVLKNLKDSLDSFRSQQVPKDIQRGHFWNKNVEKICYQKYSKGGLLKVFCISYLTILDVPRSWTNWRRIWILRCDVEEKMASAIVCFFEKTRLKTLYSRIQNLISFQGYWIDDRACLFS